MRALDLYLLFRHLFRNLYVFTLDWAEMQSLFKELPSAFRLVDSDLAAFDAFLVSLLEP